MFYKDNIDVQDIGEKMSISDKLPQFSDSPALLLVAGFQVAHLYVAHNGKLEKIKTLRIYDPAYMDHEGFFARRGRGLFLGAGSVYEDKKDKVAVDFMHELEKSLKDFFEKRSVSDIYVFAPRRTVESVIACLPNGKRDLVRQRFRGTHYKAHPFDLLKMIQKTHSDGYTRPMSAAAKKILEKTDFARKFFSKKDKNG